jgi:serine O-acetyltransferase
VAARPKPTPRPRWREAFYRTDGVGPFAINDAAGARDDLDPSFRAMVELLRGDAQRLEERHPGESLIKRAYPGLFIAALYRLSHTLHLRGSRALPIALMWLCHMLTGTEIRPTAIIGPGLQILHPSGVVVGGGVVAGARLTLVGGNVLGANKKLGLHGAPVIGDDVTIGTHAVVVGPINVGDGASVGAMSLVLDDVEAKATVKGIPAS